MQILNISRSQSIPTTLKTLGGIDHAETAGLLMQTLRAWAEHNRSIRAAASASVEASSSQFGVGGF